MKKVIEWLGKSRKRENDTPEDNVEKSSRSIEGEQYGPKPHKASKKAFQCQCENSCWCKQVEIFFS